MDNRLKFSISPGTNIMDVLGHSGYTFNFAIADLVDNCIAAHATSIEIFIDFDSSDPYLYIFDNGIGMSLQELKEAAIIGFKNIADTRKTTDLGRFSTGLKSAAKSICNNIYICSKRDGQEANTIQLDFGYIKKSQQWDAFILPDFSLQNKISNHGTIIVCKNFNMNNDFQSNNVYNKIDSLEQSLAHVFGKYLLDGSISMSIQTKNSTKNMIEGWNPFGLKCNTSTKKIYEKEEHYKNSYIYIKAFILPVYNNLNPEDQAYMIGKGLMEQQGFYIYRNRRLIQEGGWLNLPNISMDEKSKYARIEVEIDSTLDEDFQINFCKNSLIIPDELQSMFIAVAKKARSESRSSANYLKHPEFKKKLKSDENKIWLSTHSSVGTVLTINEQHPLIIELCQKLNSIEKQKLFQLLSKTIPIGMIQTQCLNTIAYSENDIWELAKKYYVSLKEQDLSLKDIKLKMKSVEPFKENINYLISFFDHLEKINDKTDLR